MPVTLEGSCRCGTVRFRMASHTPHPYQRCYCTICRKTAGGGGYAINLAARANSLALRGGEEIGIWRARIVHHGGAAETSPAERHFCRTCATALWLYDPTWPDLIHPFALAIDSRLPVPPALTHLMLDFKATWVTPEIGPEDAVFDRYPNVSIEDWHRARGLWVP